MTLNIIPFAPFELGESDLAHIVVENYINYESTNKYECLKFCFANLTYMVTEHPEKKIIATMACDALARKLFDVYNNIYVKFFIANSASSITVRAKLFWMKEINQYWCEQCLLLSKKIEEEGFDPSQAKAAGLAVLGKEEAKASGLLIIKDQ